MQANETTADSNSNNTEQQEDENQQQQGEKRQWKRRVTVGLKKMQIISPRPPSQEEASTSTVVPEVATQPELGIFLNSKQAKAALSIRSAVKNSIKGELQQDKVPKPFFEAFKIFKKRDNLSVPNMRPVFDQILSPDAEFVNNNPIPFEIIGMTLQDLQKELPVPVNSCFVQATSKTPTTPKKASPFSPPPYNEPLVHSDNDYPHYEDLMDPETIGFLIKSAVQPCLSDDEKRDLYYKLLTTNNEEIKNHHIKANTLFTDAVCPKSLKKKSSGYFDVRSIQGRPDIQYGIPPIVISISEYKVKFNAPNDVVTMDTLATREITITATQNTEVYIKEIPKTDHYTFQIQPIFLELKKKVPAKIKVTLKLTKPIPTIDEMIPIEVKKGIRHYIMLSAECEMRKFGVNPQELDMSFVEGIGEIPFVLCHLRYLLEHNNGFLCRGVFRESGSDRKLQEFKKQLNRGDYAEYSDINVIANLIKAWFREMPKGLLSAIPHNFFNSIDDKDPAQCDQLIIKIPEFNQRLLYWLLDLLVSIEQYKEINMMGAGNLAIVFAPNLYQHENSLVLLGISNKLTKILDCMVSSRKKST